MAQLCCRANANANSVRYRTVVFYVNSDGIKTKAQKADETIMKR